MKKSYVLGMMAVANVYCIAAMEFELQELLKKDQNNKKGYGTTISQKSDQTQSQKDKDFFAQLPCEVQQKITASMLYSGDLCEKNTKKIFNNPLCSIVLHMKFCDESKSCFDELQQRYPAESPLKMGNKEFSAFDLWRLPRKNRAELFAIAERSLVQSAKLFLVDPFESITPDDMKTLIEILPYDMREDLIIPVPNEWSRYHKYIPCVGGLTMSGLGIGIGIYGVCIPNIAVATVGFGVGPIFGLMYWGVCNVLLRSGRKAKNLTSVVLEEGVTIQS